MDKAGRDVNWALKDAVSWLAIDWGEGGGGGRMNVYPVTAFPMACHPSLAPRLPFFPAPQLLPPHPIGFTCPSFTHPPDP